MIVINEIAWGGTLAASVGPNDEWIELYNAGDSDVDLTDWAIYEGQTKVISLSGTISAGGYYLIERTDDSTVSDILADVFGPFGGSGLKNDPGEDLQLGYLTEGPLLVIVDRVDCSAGWFAGDAASKASMERGADGSWHTWSGTQYGQDANGNPINGTPRSPNSQG